MTPDDRKYTSQHQWLKRDADGLALVGITDFAQDQLGDVEYLELPDVGETLEEGEPYGVVESAKSSSDLFTPVDLEVVACNSEAEDDPSIINSDPYDAGWLLRVRPANADDYERLMTSAEYSEMVGE